MAFYCNKLLHISSERGWGGFLVCAQTVGSSADRMWEDNPGCH